MPSALTRCPSMPPGLYSPLEYQRHAWQGPLPRHKVVTCSHSRWRGSKSMAARRRRASFLVVLLARSDQSAWLPAALNPKQEAAVCGLHSLVLHHAIKPP